MLFSTSILVSGSSAGPISQVAVGFVDLLLSPLGNEEVRKNIQMGQW